MDLCDWLAECMTRARAVTQTLVAGLSEDELRWQPAPGANTIGFLLFHVFRGEDFQFHTAISQSGELWKRDKWYERWALPDSLPADRRATTTGNSWSKAQIDGWTPPPIADLMDYAAAVRASALAILPTIDLDHLHDRPVPGRDATVATFLYHASHHEAQHQAQIDYLLGLMRDSHAGFTTPA